jgi:hypothetical protein
LYYFLLLDENLDKISKKIMSGLDRVEGTFLGKDITFLSLNIRGVHTNILMGPALIFNSNDSTDFLLFKTARWS